MQLGLLVDGDAQRGVGRLRKPFAGPLGLGSGLRPFAMGLQDLRAVYQALASIGHQVGLGVAPPAQRFGHSTARRRSKTCMHVSITAQ
jgi:hypothetical protein